MTRPVEPIETAPRQPTLGRPTLGQPTLGSVALALLIGCCLCASLVASLI